MEIRKMEPYDLEEVTALEKDTFSTPWSKQGFADTLTMDNVVFLVATERGHVIGYCGMYMAADEGEITNVAVDPAFRMRGIGTALVRELGSRASEAGLTHVILEVRKSNRRAISLYQKQGYMEIGERRNFYQRPTEDAMVMSYEL